MSNIRYYTDGEQATADTLNRPLKDLEKVSQYMSRATAESIWASNRKALAGSGQINGKMEYVRNNSSVAYDAFWTYNYGPDNTEDNNSIFLGAYKPQRFSFNGQNIRVEHVGRADSEVNRITFPEAPGIEGSISSLNNTDIELKKKKFYKVNDTALKTVESFDTDLNGWVSRYETNTVSYDDTNNRAILTVDETYSGSTIIQKNIGEDFVMLKGLYYEISFRTDKISGDGSISPRIWVRTSSGGAAGIEGEFLSKNDGNNYTFTFKPTQNYNNSQLLIASANTSVAGTSYYFDDIKIKIKENQFFIPGKDVPVGTNLGTLNNNYGDCTDMITRHDLSFIEMWHEDVTMKDFVFPFGNVQFSDDTHAHKGYNGLTTTKDKFDGWDKYSNFGDWQDALIDSTYRGYVWSNFTDEEKLAFANEPDNNIFVEGDKIIQTRYRIRTIEGIGNNHAYFNNSGASMLTFSGARVKPQGYLAEIPLDLGEYNTPQYGWYVQPDHSEFDYTAFGLKNDRSANEADTRGVFYSLTSGSGSSTGINMVIPLAMVQRRNKGAFHPVYNLAGTAKWADDKNWNETSYTVNSIDDCFNNITGGDVASSKSGYNNGMDNFYHDVITADEVWDLRKDANKHDIKSYSEEWTNRVFNGDIRPLEGVTRYMEHYFYDVSVTAGRVYVDGNNTTAANKKPGEILRFRVLECSNDRNLEGNTYELPILTNNDRHYVQFPSSAKYISMKAMCEMTDMRFFSSGMINIMQHTGSPENLPSDWEENGYMGRFMRNDDGSYITSYANTGSVGCFYLPLSRHIYSRRDNTYNNGQGNVYDSVNGDNYDVAGNINYDIVSSSDIYGSYGTHSGPNNRVYFHPSYNNGSYSDITNTAIISYTYRTFTRYPLLSNGGFNNRKVLAINDAGVSNRWERYHYLWENFLGKICIGSTSKAYRRYGIKNKGIAPTGEYVIGSNSYALECDPVDGDVGDTNYDLVRSIPVLFEGTRGDMVLAMQCKQIKPKPIGTVDTPTYECGTTGSISVNSGDVYLLTGSNNPYLNNKYIQFTSSYEPDWTADTHDGFYVDGENIYSTTGSLIATHKLLTADKFADNGKHRFEEEIGTNTDIYGNSVLTGSFGFTLPGFIRSYVRID